MAARSRADSSSRRPAGTRESELLQSVVLHTHRVCLCSNTIQGVHKNRYMTNPYHGD